MYYLLAYTIARNHGWGTQGGYTNHLYTLDSFLLLCVDSRVVN
jgi:hypothetical protein